MHSCTCTSGTVYDPEQCHSTDVHVSFESADEGLKCGH